MNDLESTIAFYKDVLGLVETRRHKSSRGSELVFLKAQESDELIEICHFPASGSVHVQPDLTHLAFEVENLDTFKIRPGEVTVFQTFGLGLTRLGVKYGILQVGFLKRLRDTNGLGKIFPFFPF